MYRKKELGWLKHWDFELVDILCLEFAFFLSYLIRHWKYIGVYTEEYLQMGVTIFVLDVFVTFFSDTYKGILQRNLWKECVATIQHITVVQVLLLVYEYVAQQSMELSRFVFFVTWIASVILSVIGRTIVKKIVRKRMMKEKNQSKMLLFTSSDKVTDTIEKIYGKEYRDFRIEQIIMNDSYESDNVNGIPVICGKEEGMNYALSNVVDEVYIDTYEDKDALNVLVNEFLSMGIVVHVNMDFLPDNLPNKVDEKIGTSRVVTTSVTSATMIELAVKRLIDIASGIVGLIFMAIAFIFVAPAILIASPGPIFFKQERMGKNGRTFYMYKFRSMYMDAEERKKELMEHNEMNGLMFKMENDPRIIGSEKGPGKGIGNFIRKTSIDELPQFWNILIGDMSLVGTRPPTKGEYLQYDPQHKIRLSMKPGLTGMWQVSGRSDITDFDEVVRLDTEYIENWSLGLDISLILKTFIVVFKGSGSK